MPFGLLPFGSILPWLTSLLTMLLMMFAPPAGHHHSQYRDRAVTFNCESSARIWTCANPQSFAASGR